MKQREKPLPEVAELRRRAEMRLRQTLPATGRPLTKTTSLRLLHELHARQIELETRNEELARTCRELERSQKRYVDFYDFAPVGYFGLSDDGIIREVNLTAATLLGQERADPIGRRLEEFVAEGSRPCFNAFLEKAMAGMEGEGCELALATAGAPPRYLHLRCICIKPCMDGLCRVSALDVTERVRSEEKTSAERGFWRATLDSLPSHIAILDKQGVILDINAAWARFADANALDDANHGLGGNYLAVCDAAASSDAVAGTVAAGIRAVLAGTSNFFTLEYPCHAPDRQRWFVLRVTPFAGVEPGRVVVTHSDITERKRVAEELRRSEAQYRGIIETSRDGFWIADRQGRLLEANEAYARLSGYSRDELRSMRIADLDVSESHEEVAAHVEKVMREGSGLFQTLHRAKSGRIWQVEINVAWFAEEERFFVFIRDLYRRQQSEMLLKVRLELSEMVATASLDELLRAALDRAERFTGSQISFFHFVDPDQETLTLQTWSSHTLKVCAASGKGLHYPVGQAGIWADCLRQRRPIVHNRYADLPDRRGLPEGHVPLVRELTVPVMQDGRVVALVGVGNKPEDYTEADVEVMRHLTDLIMDVVQRKQAEERVAHLAYHDALTQLPNRVLLADRLQQAMAQARRDRRRLAVCYLDLDDFKPINDRWGHAAGDRVLVEMAQRLRQCVRGGDTVARLGGDEFVLLLSDLSDVEECEHALDRVMTALQASFTVAGQPTLLTASVGVTLYPDDDSDPDTLLRHVDQAMYAAKQTGGDRYQWFDAEHDRRARDFRTILLWVEAGLAAEEFHLHYQPKVDMRRGTVIGAEALIRWQHPDEGLLPPVRFMPAVETSHLAIAVGQWVIREALRQMAAWAKRGLTLPVSVNLSGRDLQQADFAARLKNLLAEYPDVPPDWLELEILETAALEDLALVSTRIKDCRALGVRFALDDFGTGYSSLTYLRHLPVQLLKIDQSFVRDLLADSEARAIVEGVIGLSSAFRREVIAEGVETFEHGRLLLDLGCNLAQGYGIARPMPPERIPDWVAGWRPPEAWAG
ncbi:MAG: EAL domain-containing protein [Candidatus Competibacter sp.]|nr:EAL domain-containing protein [Candidatus Competibacter sp.]MDG4584882.1 EAL domain-containing protein [Candidatus Competibacter sp.]